MESVSPAFLDDLRGAHGNLLKTHATLSAVVAGREYIPLKELKACLHSMSCEAFLSGKQQPSGFIFGSGLMNPFDPKEYKHFTGQLARGGHGLVTIGSTQASQLVERTAFVQRLQEAIKFSNSTLSVNQVLQGYADGEGGRVPGLWDDISRGYAQNAHGSVFTVTPNSKPTRVFVQTELPVLIANEDVETINGISTALFADYYEALRAAGVPESQAFAYVDRDVVQGSSVAFIRGYSREFERDLGITLRRDFDFSHSPHLQEAFENAHPQYWLNAANDASSAPAPDTEPEGLHH